MAAAGTRILPGPALLGVLLPYIRASHLIPYLLLALTVLALSLFLPVPPLVRLPPLLLEHLPFPLPLPGSLVLLFLLLLLFHLPFLFYGRAFLQMTLKLRNTT